MHQLQTNQQTVAFRVRKGFKNNKKKLVEYSTKGLTPRPQWKKILLAKNDLHAVKRILYDTGRQTVARWPHKRRQKLEVVSYGEMTPDPPKN